MRSVLHLFTFLAIAAAAEIQAGISGRVVNHSTGEPIREARVFVQGHPDFRGVTDLEGRYLIENLPPGVHTLRIFKPGFGLKAVKDLQIGEGSTERLDLSLEPVGASGASATVRRDPLTAMAEDGGEEGVFELAALTVSADEVQSGESALLSLRQRSDGISDGLGSDTFSRLGLGDAAEVMSKITGASVVDGKYMVIRGLGDRYTNTLLNNLTVPSADPDRRAVQLDQFPSDLLESVVVAKSFTADQPGAFSGGSVNLRTRNFPDQRFLKVGMKLAANTNVLGEDLLTVPGGGRDWMGMDDGTRALPDDFPDSLDLTLAQARAAARNGDFSVARELDALIQAFHNESFYPQERTGDPGFGLNFSLGDQLPVHTDGALGYVVSFNYDRSSSHYTDGIVGRYTEGRRSDYDSPDFVSVSRVFTPDESVYNFASFIEAGSEVPGGPPAFGVTRSAYSVDWGSLAQVAYAPSGNHEIAFRYLHNQSADDVIKRGIGEAVRSDSGGEFRENIDLLYTERSMSSTQLEGGSVFPVGGEDLRLDWRMAASESTQEQPDYRNLEFKWSYIFDDYDPSGVFQNRYFRDMEDDNLEAAVDFTYPLDLAEGRRLELKTGVLYSDGERSYRGRQFQIQNFSLPRSDPESAYERIRSFPQPAGLIAIDEANRSVEFGTVMRETDSNLNYDGFQTIGAVYGMFDWQFAKRWRTVAGARYAATEIQTVPLPTSNIEPEEGLIDQGDWLPSLSLIWEIGDAMNVRASYGRTVARPTYRELAAVRIYEPFTAEYYEGNPNLEMSVIDNYDLRWEYFIRPSELIAVSAFYKEIEHPIELVFSDGATRPLNGGFDFDGEAGTDGTGKVYGIEFEYRQMLDFWTSALQGLSFGMNLAIIESEVGIAEHELAAIRELDPEAEDRRPLFGQSDYTFNMDLSYFHQEWNTTFTVTYNVTGERLDLVTTGPLPDVYEQPAPTLNLIVSTLLRGGWSAKFGVENLLDPHFEKTLFHEGDDFVYERYQIGRTVSLSVSREF